MMENCTKKIVSIITMDKRETGKKSTNMEKACFLKAMEEMQGTHDLTVDEVVTDAQLQIGALMKNRFPDIKHSHDIWHVAKNLGKKIVAAGQTKECRSLIDWSKDIVNHFWYTCSSARNRDRFMEIWCGIVHHVVNEHEWGMSYSSSYFGANQCMHGPLQDEHKEWIVKGSASHKALIQIVFKKRFLNQIHYYLNFRSTGEVENFNNLILMYSGKRFAYSPPVYRARSQLAALDYNAHMDRETKRKPDGTIQQHRTFNKKSGRWSVTPVKVEKSYEHVSKLMTNIVVARISDEEGMSHPVVLGVDDPRRLSKTIAPTEPKPTIQLQQEKVSRFQK
ncbi:uncharacterized protein LOC125675325 [Ostrea edulis]|uniref:uncharacterized protein LOC125675325 n=1 Tax=Ostrea edulis TaxID=37623 RepID=UPI0024AFAF4B|nr:uncharacterized protein LOC125675325 [Ostrea edulis]